MSAPRGPGGFFCFFTKHQQEFLMPTPIDPLVAEMVEQLNLDLQADFQERAAIIEYDAKVQRAHAEALALLNILDRHRDALSGVVCLCVEVDGVAHFYVADCLERAREHAAVKRANEIRAAGIAFVLDTEFGNLGELIVAE
jgi:hypothetical protein